ncbi:MAG: hypothetical protein U1F77_03460 [Kiritimatiellia bacterium]
MRALIPTVTDNCGAGEVVVVQSPPAGTVLTGGTTVSDAGGDGRLRQRRELHDQRDGELRPAGHRAGQDRVSGHDGGSFCLPGAEIVISTNNAPDGLLLR